ncbi:hypothetical protein P3T76_010638 [Phytophthora citrophthora]|uniref:RxLR effector protein n=1 Tax=Phytophthora citrophthora TaxID=4793 RepID=A0AAD9GBG8_9STRA|nr:hypothetical protein P3T76_010638 [Phytophthora citrophthora]
MRLSSVFVVAATISLVRCDATSIDTESKLIQPLDVAPVEKTRSLRKIKRGEEEEEVGSIIKNPLLRYEMEVLAAAKKANDVLESKLQNDKVLQDILKKIKTTSGAKTRIQDWVERGADPVDIATMYKKYYPTLKRDGVEWTAQRLYSVLVLRNVQNVDNLTYTLYDEPQMPRDLRALRRASLRPVLFLLVFFFVLVPLVVYHFVTFDFQRVASFKRHFRASPTSVSVPVCLGINSTEFLRSDATQTLKARCGVQSALITSKLRLVHFVNVALDAVPLWPGEQQTDREQFTYLQFSALQSARRVLKPDMMMMHYLETPRGVWYTQCQRHLGLHQVLPPVSFDHMKEAGPPFLNRQERRRIVEVLVMLKALKKNGGVAFSDFNTFLMRGIGVDVQEELVVASQAGGKRFSIGLHVMQAPPGHPFVEFLEQEIIEMVGRNDVKLHQMSLDEVVGQLVLEKYREDHERSSDGNDTRLSRSSSVMDGVVIGTSNLFEFDGLHELLTEKLSSNVAGKFQGVAGFHVDRYNFEEQTEDTEDLREVARMQKEFTLAGEWQSLDTVLGAVVRLAVTANTTAELEPLFT